MPENSRTGDGAPQGIVLAQAIREIRAGGCTCVLIQSGVIVFRGEGRGVAPVRRLYDSPDGRALMRDGLLADKVVGKALAILLVLGGVAAAHGATMSSAALDYLERHGVLCTFGQCVEYIQNRDGTGLCPIEQSVLDIEDPQEGYAAIVATIARLMENR